MATFPRAGGDMCPAGTFFYTCDTNNFRGCCGVDPCDRPGCPETAHGHISASTDGDETEAKATKTRMTDSGITHTVPNSSVVTITRHTVIFTDAPSSWTEPSETPWSRLTASSGSQSSTAVSSAEPSKTWSAETDKAHGTGSMSTGAIVGIAVGALVGASLVAIMIVALMRRRQSRQSPSPRFDYKPPKLQSYLSDGVAAEKQDARLQDTSASGGDPFAPFGGRIDRDPYRVPSRHFEMDASQSAPVELPSEHYETMAQYAPATDPNAVLSSPRTTSGTVAHLGYWNHWRAPGDNQDG
ncbi:hypothetical protein CDD81_7772 [Ophiocordyceps australis]|uniref:Uncharacterized protein n=1 Tax=Ophiocordyceps australis TaxID=1399860 RepID=A0A2C5Y4G9_9HYPO|nr:hypothetical protein CDD81_7772 [Ophiocordyceps australis]